MRLIIPLYVRSASGRALAGTRRTRGPAARPPSTFNAKRRGQRREPSHYRQQRSPGPTLAVPPRNQGPGVAPAPVRRQAPRHGWRG